MTPREANADLLAEIAALRDRLASLTRESAERQVALTQGGHREAATSEILGVISSSPTNLQPVFEAIARSTVRLCEGARSTVWRPEGDLLRCVARWDMTPDGHVVRASSGESVDAESIPGSTRPCLPGSKCRSRSRPPGGDRVCRFHREAPGSRQPAGRAPVARAGGDWGHHPGAEPRRALLTSADRGAPDLRGSGCDRHRERAVVQGAADE